MYYKHDLNYTYPERSDEHMLELKRTRELTLDENYEYMPKGVWFKIKRALVATLLNLIVFPIMHLTHGLKIYGRENLKKHKKELKNGAITISNHVFMWDYLCVLKAIRPHISYFPAWKPNFESGFQSFMRIVGGIPIPEGDYKSIKAFKKGMDEVLESGNWLHVFPEGSLWYFYPDIRPLKLAAFNYAVKYDKPLIPISMSFRPRTGFRKIFGKGPFVDLHIAEPLYADKSLPCREAAKDLRKRAYAIMQQMNGIFPGDENYNEEHDFENYKKTM
ncbi:MAG: 1-acyl-sn-glycerol-3-phosphate acyltransferase [Clostridiales bacterium]|nr:1-acyl-sn-glycerol-3-phosphate acyltransferase [Clostridiales bacterium]